MKDNPLFKIIIDAILLCIFIWFAATFPGCATWTTAPSVCDNPPGKSYICDIANDLDIRIETVGQTLIAINAANIGLWNLYTVEQAVDVMQNIRGILDEPISYTFFIFEVEQYIRQYPGMIDVAKDFLKELDKLIEPIAAFDRTLLIYWLDEQIVSLQGAK